MYYFQFLTLRVHVGFFEVLKALSSIAHTPEMIREFILITVFSLVGLIIFFINTNAVNRQKKINTGETKAGAGNRFTKTMPFSGDYEQMKSNIERLLNESGYQLQNYGDEKIYRNGNGMFVASKCFKFEQAPEGGILVEAFVIISGKEHGLDGFVAIAAKKPLKKIVEKVITMIETGR
jgi:hypothetical protein